MDTDARGMIEAGYGWIWKGKAHKCGMYEHRTLALEKLIPRGRKRDELLRRQEELDEIEESCNELSERGEHPEWHCYEMANDDFAYDVMDAAYSIGLVRFGTAGTVRIAEVEGKLFALRDNRDIIRDLCDLMPSDWEFGVTVILDSRDRETIPAATWLEKN